MRRSERCATRCATVSKRTPANNSAGADGTAARADHGRIYLCASAGLVDREIENLLGEAKSYIERAGVIWDEYLAKQEKNEDALRAEYREEAEKRVKSSLLLEAIAKAENVTGDESRYRSRSPAAEPSVSTAARGDLEMIRSNIGALVDGIVRTKTVDFLLDNAQISETGAAAPSV